MLRMKRRVYSTGLILIILSGVSSTVMAVLGTTSYPSLAVYLGTNGLMILVSLTALLALRDLKYLRVVEVGLTLVTVGLLLYWDIVPLLELLPVCVDEVKRHDGHWQVGGPQSLLG